MAKEANKAGPWVESKVAIGVFRNSVYMTIPLQCRYYKTDSSADKFTYRGLLLSPFVPQ
jgi:hypothetical protein